MRVFRVKDASEFKDQNSYPWLNSTDGSLKFRDLDLLKFRSMYHLHWSKCKKLWGNPNWQFRGEWLYKIYVFKIVSGDKKQYFALYADPDKCGKGSTFELFHPICDELVVPIIHWLHSKGKENDK